MDLKPSLVAPPPNLPGIILKQPVSKWEPDGLGCQGKPLVLPVTRGLSPFPPPPRILPTVLYDHPLGFRQSSPLVTCPTGPNPKSHRAGNVSDLFMLDCQGLTRPPHPAHCRGSALSIC